MSHTEITKFHFSDPNLFEMGSAVLLNRTLAFYLTWQDETGESVHQDLHRWVSSCLGHAHNKHVEHIVIMAWPHELMPKQTLLTTIGICETISQDAALPVIVIYNDACDIGNTHSSVSVVGCDYFAVAAHYRYKDHDIKWNPVNQKAFFLLGKVYKYNRLPLLYNLVQSGIVGEYLDYSFGPVPAVNSEQCEYDTWQQAGQETLRLNVRDLPKDFDYEQWAWQHAHTLDRPLGHDAADCDSNNFTGLDLNEELYHTHCLEVISETHYDRAKFITEKTYRNIAMGYPFLILGPEFRNVLSDKGYKLYEDILSHNYEIPEDFQTRSHIIEMENMPIKVQEFCRMCTNDAFIDQVVSANDHNRNHIAAYSDTVTEQLGTHIHNFHCIAYDLFLHPLNFVSHNAAVLTENI